MDLNDSIPQWFSVILLGIAVYFLSRLVGKIDKLENSFVNMTTDLKLLEQFVYLKLGIETDEVHAQQAKTKHK